MAAIGFIAILYLLWKIAYKKGYSKAEEKCELKVVCDAKKEEVKKKETDEDAIIVERGGKRYVLVEID